MTRLFSLPGFFTMFDFNVRLIVLTQSNPEYFKDNTQIFSLYDSFPCIWNGGRTIRGVVSYDQIYATLSIFKDLGVQIRHTFTNQYIDSNTIHDQLGNTILKICKEIELDTAVNTTSIYMEDYIKNKYPKFQIIKSTMCCSDIKSLNQNAKTSICVPDYRLNNNFDELSKIDLENRPNIEMITGERCIDECPTRNHHHITSAKNNMYLPAEPFECPYGCEGDTEFSIKLLKTRKHFITNELMCKYDSMGIFNYKLSGRSDGTDAAAVRAMYYLVKPEYYKEVSEILVGKTLFVE